MGGFHYGSWVGLAECNWHANDMLRLVSPFLLLVMVSCSLAEQCVTLEDNLCVARCSNGTVLDISKLFQFPYAENA